MIDDEIVNALKEQEPEPRNKYIKKLEKENAKLKSLLEEKHKVGNCEFWKRVWHSIWRNEELEEQLTKAKEIILKLSTCLEGHSNNNFEYELLQEAEQFLKEE